MSTSQKVIRKNIRAKRRALTSFERRTAAQSIAKLITSNRHFRLARNIAFYWPNDGEIDLRPLINRAWAMKKKCYLPVLFKSRKPQLTFALYTCQSKLIFNRFKIPEPQVPHYHKVNPARLDLIFTPLVAFDKRCNRIGMGGGFYDRTFAFLGRRHHWRKPKLIGVAYDLQKISTIDANPWDIPLDSIITEQKTY